jgi:hypothetical protein
VVQHIEGGLSGRGVFHLGVRENTLQITPGKEGTVGIVVYD